MKLWKKTGLIASFISLVVFLITFALSKFEAGQVLAKWPYYGYLRLNKWLFGPISSATGCKFEGCFGSWFFISFIFSLFEFFILGALIGLFISKLKKKSMISLPQTISQSVNLSVPITTGLNKN